MGVEIYGAGRICSLRGSNWLEKLHLLSIIRVLTLLLQEFDWERYIVTKCTNRFRYLQWSGETGAVVRLKSRKMAYNSYPLFSFARFTIMFPAIFLQHIHCSWFTLCAQLLVFWFHLGFLFRVIESIKFPQQVYLMDNIALMWHSACIHKNSFNHHLLFFYVDWFQIIPLPSAQIFS